MANNEKVLTIGGQGYVGQLFIDRHQPDYGHLIDYSQSDDNSFDIANPESVAKIVKENNPDIIIIFAAITNTKPDITQASLYQAVNVQGPQNVINAAIEQNIIRNKNGQPPVLVVQISTDQVFKGDKGPDYLYTEADHPDATIAESGLYAGTKKLAEDIVAGYKPHLIIRLGNPTSLCPPPRSDYFRKIFDSLEKNGKAMLFSNQLVCGTVTQDFVDAISGLISGGYAGTYNATGPECLSAYQWGVVFAQQLGLTPTEIEKFIIPTDVVAYNQNSAGYKFPESLHLSIDKLLATGIKMRSPREIASTVIASIPESRRQAVLQQLRATIPPSSS